MLLPASSKPTIVLVPGAWHGPSTFAFLTPLLQAQKFHVIAVPQLPCINSALPIAADIVALRAILLGLVDQGKDVVLVLHSYAGVVGIQAACGLAKGAKTLDGEGKGKGGVVKMVFLSANVPKVGESHFEQIMGWFVRQGMTPPSFVEVGEDGTARMTGSENIFYNDLAAAQHPELMEDLRAKTQSLATFTTPVSQSACTEIPSWYLISTLDQCHPPAFQYFVAKGIRDDYCTLEVIETIEAGHSAMLSQPDKVADFIVRAAMS